MLRFIYPLLLLSFLLSSCNFENTVTLQSIDGLSLDMEEDLNPVLTVQASLYNASSYSLKLTELQMEIFVSDKKVATVDEQLKLTIASESDFTVPLKVRLSLEEMELLGAILSLFNDKKHTIRCVGHVKLNFWGFFIQIPISYTKE